MGTLRTLWNGLSRRSCAPTKANERSSTSSDTSATVRNKTPGVSTRGFARNLPARSPSPPGALGTLLSL
eukprot:1830096-Rhodomonas_salina.1